MKTLYIALFLLILLTPIASLPQQISDEEKVANILHDINAKFVIGDIRLVEHYAPECVAIVDTIMVNGQNQIRQLFENYIQSDTKVERAFSKILTTRVYRTAVLGSAVAAMTFSEDISIISETKDGKSTVTKIRAYTTTIFTKDEWGNWKINWQHSTTASQRK